MSHFTLPLGRCRSTGGCPQTKTVACLRCSGHLGTKPWDPRLTEARDNVLIPRFPSWSLDPTNPDMKLCLIFLYLRFWKRQGKPLWKNMTKIHSRWTPRIRMKEWETFKNMEFLQGLERFYKKGWSGISGARVCAHKVAKAKQQLWK